MKKIRIIILFSLFIAPIFFVAKADAYSLFYTPTQQLAAVYTDPDCTSKSIEKCDIISNYINPAIKLLAAVAAVAAITGITIGGIQYSTSAGDPQAVGQGKKKIIAGLTGFVAFLFLASFVQFISPGGIDDRPGSMPGPNAAKCSKGRTFMGVKPWYVYLPANRFDVDGESCAVTNFKVLPKTGVSDLVPVSLAVLDGLLRISGIIAVVFVAIGGIKYVTSQGEPSETAQAKDSIINAMIGLVVIMIAAGVITFIGTQLSGP